MAIPRLKSSSGPAFLSYGFRPFFLAGASYAGLAILIWLPIFFGHMSIPTALSPVDWHVHEMLYGFLPAVITGFLLTAIPNWTGQLPLQGSRLAVLVVLWLAGRIATFFSALIGPALAGVIDCSFLLLIALAISREVIVGRNWRNLAPVSLVFIFLAGNIVFQIEDYVSGSANIGMRLGIGAAVVMISLVGGRVVPSFTRNWLVRENPGRLPASFGRFDSSIVAVSALTVSLWAFCPDWKGTALLALISGLGQLVRLGRWAGNRAWRDRLVLVLHIGYAFVPLGFLLLGASILFPATVPVSGAVHAWTAGAIGTMTLAIMTRASLGHTGRPLSADWITHVIYGLVILAALFRIAAAFSVQIASFLLYLAGGLWIAGFWLFALSYGPLLCRPRIRPRS